MSAHRVLITAGPTREYLDDVRFVSNASSGRMGIACSNTAVALGMEVTLVLGPVEVVAEFAPGISVVPVISTAEMCAAVQARFARCDIFISSAAVADYAPKVRLPGKLHKGNALSIEFVRTVDILAWAGGVKTPQQRLVGFSLEATMDIARGAEKREL